MAEHPAAKTITLAVTGMTCAGCERAVTGTLLGTEGVKSARASHKDRRVDVTYDPARITASELKAAIVDLGYFVEG